MGKEEQGKTAISDKSTFQVDLSAKKVWLTENGLSVDVGDTLAYLLH